MKTLRRCAQLVAAASIFWDCSIDLERNQAAVGREAEIQTPDSKVKVLVIATNEELAIAGDTYQIAKELAEP